MSHNPNMGYFKLTCRAEFRPSTCALDGLYDDKPITILFHRPAPSLHEPSTAYIHTNLKYITQIRDLFMENPTSPHVRISRISPKQLGFETKDLTVSYESFPPANAFHLHKAERKRRSNPTPHQKTTTQRMMVK